MLIKNKRNWEISENNVSPKEVWLNRRNFLKTANILSFGFFFKNFYNVSVANSKQIDGFPAWKNNIYNLLDEQTKKEIATTFNNYYEFGSSKNIWREAQKLNIDPWKVTIDGLVESEINIDAYDLIKLIGPQEERIYRFRCVEAWSMVLPWTGVPMKNFVELAKPNSSAKYIKMQTFLDKEVAAGQTQSWYPWPYIEGITIEEATNELAFIATGLYGEKLQNQNGAPLRLMLPWKYGFKNIKAIVRFTFTDKKPVGMWEQLSPEEYGFWANVNPNVDHPRWKQSKEKIAGTKEEKDTLMFNGYEKEVSYIYNKYEHYGKNLYK